MSIGPKRFVCREAADPSVILFRDRYFLFASMSGGFWHSADLVDWEFLPAPNLPNYDYAPDACEVDGALVVCASRASGRCSFHRSTDPLAGHWEEIPGSFAFWDPSLFQDDDGRLYLYWGCSARTPIQGVELDRRSFAPLGDKVVLVRGDPHSRGWERKGENHRQPARENLLGRLVGLMAGKGPFIEGAWMTKHDGRYYLQYAAPGTELNTYADGYYVGDGPLGPFSYAPQSPFSSKPAGFINAAGHGSTFQDRHGNWWHAASMRISKGYMFERRIGLFPAGFDADGTLFCNQQFADHPVPIPAGRVDPWTLTPSWMLLSYRCPVTASSASAGHPPALAVDEDVRTWWVPDRNGPGEWIVLDLGADATVHAIQVNLAEHGMVAPRRPWSHGRWTALWRRHIDMTDYPAEFLLEVSNDGTTWTVAADTRDGAAGRTHRYVELREPGSCRYVRLTGFEQPYGGVLAVSGLRVFGRRSGHLPAVVVPRTSRLGPLDILVQWDMAPGADGYNVRYGLRPDKLYASWLVRDGAELRIGSLNRGQDYWVAVDTFNGSGISRGEPVHLPAPAPATVEAS